LENINGSIKQLCKLIKSFIHAEQIGISILHAERNLQAGLQALSQGDKDISDSKFNTVIEILDWEISTKRSSYGAIIKNAGDVIPVDTDAGAVKIWPVMTAKNGDMEWNFAVKSILISPNHSWSPFQQNIEKVFYVLNGRGSVILEGNMAKVFSGDAFCIPPNIAHRINTIDHNYPLELLVWETFPDMKHDELKGESNYFEFPPFKLKEKATEADAKTALKIAASDVDKAHNLGIQPLYEANLYFEVAQSFFKGGDFGYAHAFANFTQHQIQKYITDLEDRRSLIVSQGVPITNKMYLDKQFFHAGTCPAWLLNVGLPIDYTQFISSFEIEAESRLGPHFHNMEEFYYILDGRGLMMVADPIGNRFFEKNQPGIEVNPGDLIRIPPDSLHSILPIENGHRIMALALGGYADEKVEGEDIGWEDAYQENTS
jgi:mannose-6-phosphate isomerase-like protein (cupin superfamily)